MTSLRRWCVVAVVAAVVVAAPLLPRLVPASASDVTAAELLSRVQASGDQAYSGYVETDGAVQLAVGDDFSDLAELFGDRLRLRVWWQDEDAWRVNRLLLSGEEDLVHDGERTTSYDYERARAVTSRDPDIRLPRTSDLVPPSMGRITTDGADADEVSRLPARRIAGVSAPGLRLEPASGQTTIDHVDLWADEETGLALRVEVYAGSSAPVLTTVFEEFSAAGPEPDQVADTWSGQVERDFDDTVDLADAANQYAPFRVPRRVAGLERRTAGTGAVGVYGTGVTRLIAVPLREGDADDLRESLLGSPAAVATDTGTLLAVGPVSVFLTSEGFSYVLAGTVTDETLLRAAEDIVAGVRLRGRFE
ncbi:MAG: transcriptional regulator [Pimelobacter sp.]|nr:transcriptional regulator [Pimelobacter sp.]